jgi:hypothetical protein
MNKKHTSNGFTLKAYQGSFMTLLAMNFDARPQNTLAGFTLFYTDPNGNRKPIKNILNFTGKEEITSSEIAPIQMFSWVHFPNSYSMGGMLAGDYVYEATPRYFAPDGSLLPLNPALTVKITDFPVGDFKKGKLSIGFTRAFVKSQAFSNRYGAKQRLLPKDKWIFDTTEVAGTNPDPRYGDFTYEEMYEWLGFSARKMVNGMLKEALDNNDVTIEMFAYDFNDPVMADYCLKLAAAGKIRMILDNAALHWAADKSGKPTKENIFQKLFEQEATGAAEIYRCKFGRYAHCKVIILKKNGVPYKVAAGSTNFSYTGLYVNANHVLLYDDENIANYYSQVFNRCWQNGEGTGFKATNFANNPMRFNTAPTPDSIINFSPHEQPYAKNLLDSLTAVINDPQNNSVLFSVMEMGEKSTGSVIPALRALHKNDKIFTYGVTDKASGVISLYKPGKKNGILIDAKAQATELPPPFKREFTLGFMHAIHHKFVVTNFNRPDAKVYCSSSNLALGGEMQNSDNLICINDEDVATVFAIEAMRLTDHYNFRTLKMKESLPGKKKEPVKLDSTGKWADKYFDPNDIKFVQRELFG